VRMLLTSVGIAARDSGLLGVSAGPIDDQTALRVVDGTVNVISEGDWLLYNATTTAARAASEEPS
jgi:hypothetical protein